MTMMMMMTGVGCGGECVLTRAWTQCVFDVDFTDGLTLIELADGVTVEEVKSKTEAPFTVSEDVKPM